jgi:hypothetical protein
MKKINNSLLILALLSFTLLGCHKKNNDTAENLDGKWEITKITKGNGVVDDNSMPKNVSLIACKVQNNDCTGLWVSNKGDANNFFWTVKEKGSEFVIMLADNQPSNQATSDLAEYKGVYDIMKLTDDKLVINKANITMEFKK